MNCLRHWASSGTLAFGLVFACGGSTATGTRDGAKGGNGGADATSLGGDSSAPASGGTTGGTAASASISLEDFPMRWQAALCRKVITCMGSLATKRAVASCTSNSAAVAVSNFAPTRDAVERGSVLYDAAAASEFIQAFDTLQCKDFDALKGMEQKSVFSGTVALGGACLIDKECLGAAQCESSGACPGTCQPLGEPGAPCKTQYDCELGLACSTASTCQKRLAWAAACTLGDICPTFTFCQPGSDGTKQCLPAATQSTFLHRLGDPCELSAGDFCAEGLSCAEVVTGGGPRECVEVAAAGGACRRATPSMCPDGQYCQLGSGEVAGTCKDAPKEAEACAVLADGAALCADSYTCINSHCATLKANEASCTESVQCASSYCKNGSCAAKLDCEP